MLTFIGHFKPGLFSNSVQACVDGLHLCLQRIQVVEVGKLVSSNDDLGSFFFNKGPLDVAVALDEHVPGLVLIAVPLSLEEGEFASHYLFWSEFADMFQQLGVFERLDDLEQEVGEGLLLSLLAVVNWESYALEEDRDCRV